MAKLVKYLIYAFGTATILMLVGAALSWYGDKTTAQLAKYYIIFFAAACWAFSAGGLAGIERRRLKGNPTKFDAGNYLPCHYLNVAAALFATLAALIDLAPPLIHSP